MIDKMCERLQFNNETKLKTYLACELSKLDNLCPSNIFIHQIRDYSRSEYHLAGEKTIMSKINSILGSGFQVYPYASICGTMKGIGESHNMDINKIINYSYYNDSELTAKILFAFPKQVKVKDKDLEFCSYNGKTDVLQMPELIEQYKTKAGGKPCNHHLKFCVLDAIKSYKNLPTSYILGIVLKYHNKEGYEFLNPHTHLMYGGQEAFENHQKKVEEAMTKLYDKHGESVDDVIIGEYKIEIKYLDSLSDMDI